MCAGSMYPNGVTALNWSRRSRVILAGALGDRVSDSLTRRIHSDPKNDYRTYIYAYSFNHSQLLSLSLRIETIQNF